MDHLRNGLSKKSNLELTKNYFKVLHCCKDKSFSDVCEVWIRISSTALRRCRTTKTSSTKRYMIVYETKQWSFLHQANVCWGKTYHCKKIPKQENQSFWKWMGIKLNLEFFCGPSLLFCIQPDLKICCSSDTNSGKKIYRTEHLLHEVIFQIKKSDRDVVSMIKETSKRRKEIRT